MIVKIPVTKAGVTAIEEATSRGMSINATVCFTVPQAIAVAEAVERGLKRREAEGRETSRMGPVCTIMVGRLDDWLNGGARTSRRPRAPRMGRCGRHEEDLPALQGAGLPHAPAFGGLPQPHALVRVHRRGRGGDAHPPLAETLQRSAIEIKHRIDTPVDVASLKAFNRTLRTSGAPTTGRDARHGVRLVRADPQDAAVLHRRLP